MKIIEGTYNGFCMGVKTAVEAVERAICDYGSVYTLGPIIHNQGVVDQLRAKGATPVDKIEEVPNNGVVVIRSHGAPLSVYENCAARGIRVIDATCRFVAHIQKMVQEKFREGHTIVIAGEPTHPEVVGIAARCENKAHIVRDANEAALLPVLDRPFLVAQTTCIPEVFRQIEECLREKNDTLCVEQTICAATWNRQKEAAELAKQCDAMLVVGGKDSSNSAKLYKICKKYCNNVQFIESSFDVCLEKLVEHDIIGIIAGASTPQWSIREVIASMNENEREVTFTPEVEEVVQAVEEVVAQPDEKEEERELTPQESFERDIEKTMIRIRPGQVKKGTVVQIVGDDVFVNIGYKADGVIPQSELSIDPKASAADIVAVGDEVTVEILKVNDGDGNVLLSKRTVDLRNENKKVIAELEDGRHFEVHIKQAVKGGLLGEYRSARVFIPASHVSDKFVENLEEYAGKRMNVKAIEIDKSCKRIVASRKLAIKEEKVAEAKKKFLAFEAGQVVKGVVRRITDFGAFTDIGGVDGLIHVTDLAWSRVRHPSDIVKVGDEVEVQVLSVNPETERIALGYKQLQPKPWDNVTKKYLVGDIVEGRVDRIAPFGAFVELERGLFGLVHISQVATRRIEKVEDELCVGDIITVKVLEVNPETRRISLSRRAVLQQNAPVRAEVEEQDQQEKDDDYYEIPPVEEAKVSLADLFQNLELDK